MRYIFLLLICVFMFGCGQSPKPLNVDIIYSNGVIWTGASDKADARVMAIDDGDIVFVGQDLPALMSSDVNIDLSGQFIMAGFMDNHVHFMEGGAALASVDLRSAKTPDAFKNRLINYANGLPKGRWVLNGNWDQTQWGGELPHKDWIDTDTPDPRLCHSH